MNIDALKQKFIIALSLLFIAFTALLSIRYYKNNYKPNLVIYEPGYQYANFLPYLKNVNRLGYLTNKSTAPESGFEDFLQAQYMLAPRIVDLNQYDHAFNILDFMVESKDQVYVFYMLNKLNAEKIADNDWGRVLARRKK